MSPSTHFPDDKKIMYYGNADKHIEPVKLSCGSLFLEYIKGSLHNIRLGNTILINWLFPAVRDRNWRTVPMKITSEEISRDDRTLTIRYTAYYEQGEISFKAENIIEADKKGNLSFTFSGKALEDFKKNRIGLNVLLPVEPCAGRPCKVEQTDGNTSETHFPEFISPHQPFMNMKAISWDPEKNVHCRIEFEGDTFEAEDHRNWTDHSYKIYSTPLDLPFPVDVKKDETALQTVKLRAQGNVKEKAQKESVHTFSIDYKAPPSSFPKIGISKSSHYQTLGAADMALLKQIAFTHYRIDLKLFEDGWERVYHSAVQEARALDIPPELTLHFSDNWERECHEFIHFQRNTDRHEIKCINVFHGDEVVTTKALLQRIVPLLKEHFPHSKLGAGSDHFFTELNRNRIPTEGLDFITFSINPQVHAFNNIALVENLRGQAEVVKSARHYFKDIPVHVSPVTFRMRRNPNATSNEDEKPGTGIPNNADVRQMSLFGAGWSLGSMKYLAEEGAESITYFETAGLKGIIQGSESSPDMEQFPAQSNQVFPVYYIFREILKEAGEWQFIPSHSSHPDLYDGLVLSKGEKQKLFLSSFTDQPLEVHIPDIQTGTYDSKNINALNYKQLCFFKEKWQHKKLRVDSADKCYLELLPYETVIIEG
jgi:D-apionolactonase